MGRKKKDETNAGTQFWEETEVMEKAEISNEIEEPVNEGFAEDGDYVSDTDEATELEETTEEETDEDSSEETEEPKQEKSLAEEADEEFMAGIMETPVKLTPKQREAKILKLEEDIAKTSERMQEIEVIAELAVSTGFRALVEEVKAEVHDKIDDEDIKTSKDGLKVLEAVLLTEKTVNRFRFQYNEKKASVKSWQEQIIELKAGQLTIYDGLKSSEEEVAESNIEASNSQVEEELAAAS